ncbi:hypothetical protein GOV07_05820 [Candidatus Woesearchaeota archaeon]|nr:hypothetical protein [Candidatus Woesearchaeota archaeon]
MKKKCISILSAVIIAAIGIYMVASSAYPTPPFLSGIVFIIIGLNLWIPYCPICKKFCKN